MIWLIIATVLGVAAWCTWLTIRVDNLEKQPCIDPSSGGQSQWHGKFVCDLEEAVWKVIPGADMQTTDDGQIIIYTELAEHNHKLKQFVCPD